MSILEKYIADPLLQIMCDIRKVFILFIDLWIYIRYYIYKISDNLYYMLEVKIGFLQNICKNYYINTGEYSMIFMSDNIKTSRMLAYFYKHTKPLEQTTHSLKELFTKYNNKDLPIKLRVIIVKGQFVKQIFINITEKTWQINEKHINRIFLNDISIKSIIPSLEKLSHTPQ